MNEMPIGLTMAFSENLDSYKYFSTLPPTLQQQVIDTASKLHAKEDIANYVKSLPPDPHFF